MKTIACNCKSLEIAETWKLKQTIFKGDDSK